MRQTGYNGAMQLGPPLAIILAPFVGSFLGVVIERLPAGRSIVFGRSTCDRCGATLAARDLVPLVSWLARRGLVQLRPDQARPVPPGHRARRAGGRALGRSGAVRLAALGQPRPRLDPAHARRHRLARLRAARHHHLAAHPEPGLAVAWAVDPGLLGDHALGALAGFASLAVIASVYRRVRGREGLGLGDAKLLAAAGAWLGWQALPSVVLIAAASGLALALATRARRR